MNRDQQGRVSIWLTGLVLLAAVAVWQWHASHAQKGVASEQAAAGAGKRWGGAGGAMGPQPVAVQPVSRRDVNVSVSAIGSFIAWNTAVVRVQVSGVLQSLNFKEGQQVRAGQTLAQIDPRAFQASLDQAEGVLARDKAQLDNARIDLDRYRVLLGKDAIGKQQVDTQEALVRQLDGAVRSDQAAVDSARLQLVYTRVLAPISGRVGIRQVDVGNVVSPTDASGLISITQTRPIALVFAVPSAALPKMMAAMRAHRPLVVLALDRGGGSLLAKGQVDSIDNAIDVTTDTIKVKALFPNTDDALFPNQAVSVSLLVDTLHDALAVPPAAVLKGAKGAYVYVVGADNTVSAVVVKPGPTDGDWMAVEGALHAGDRVVIDGVDRLREGAKVEVIASDVRQRAGAGRARHGELGRASAAQ